MKTTCCNNHGSFWAANRPISGTFEPQTWHVFKWYYAPVDIGPQFSDRYCIRLWMFWKTPRISQVGRVIKGVRPAPNDSLLLNWSTRLAGPNGGQQESLPGRGIFAHLLQHLSQMTIWDGEENTWACHFFLCLIILGHSHRFTSCGLTATMPRARQSCPCSCWLKEPLHMVESKWIQLLRSLGENHRRTWKMSQLHSKTVFKF